MILIRLLSLALCCGLVKGCSSKDLRDSDFEDSGDVGALITMIDRMQTHLESEPHETLLAPDSFPLRLEQGDLLFTYREIGEKARWWGMSNKFYTWFALNMERVPLQPGYVKVGLLTGYYEASLRGSRRRYAQYQYPLYRTPSDLVAVPVSEQFPRGRGQLIDESGHHKPYFIREEIDFEGALAGRELEIVYLDDAIGRRFLHIQGSGVIDLDDGSRIRVGFAERNGHPYRAIGTWLIKQGVMNSEEVTMQSIVAYLKEHPEHLRSVLSFDPSYVFFRELDEGPLGSLGVVLTPFRSIAVDTEFIPGGALLLLRSFLPTVTRHRGEAQPPSLEQWQPIVSAQDTGGAIKGPNRIDLFTGRGPHAEEIAGRLRSEVQLELVIKPVSLLRQVRPE